MVALILIWTWLWKYRSKFSISFWFVICSSLQLSSLANAGTNVIYFKRKKIYWPKSNHAFLPSHLVWSGVLVPKHMGHAEVLYLSLKKKKKSQFLKISNLRICKEFFFFPVYFLLWIILKKYLPYFLDSSGIVLTYNNDNILETRGGTNNYLTQRKYSDRITSHWLLLFCEGFFFLFDFSLVTILNILINYIVRSHTFLVSSGPLCLKYI